MLKKIVLDHIKKHGNSYIAMSIVFVIGICLGVGIINRLDEEKFEVIQKYFFEYKNNIANVNISNIKNLLLNGIFNKSRFIFILFALACTVIFEKLIYFCVLYKGFSIGYSISASIKVYGVRKGILFAITTLGIQNIIYIPCILFFSIYCINFCKKIKNNNVDIKRCFLKLFVVFCIIIVISTFSSCLEMLFSYKILKKIQIFF